LIIISTSNIQTYKLLLLEICNLVQAGMSKIKKDFLSEKRWKIEGCSCRLTGNRNTVFTKEVKQKEKNKETIFPHDYTLHTPTKVEQI